MAHESLRITNNHPKTISDRFVNHWELHQSNFREVHESLRITPKQFQSGLWITVKSLIIAPKQLQSGLQITENHPKIISDWFMNHQESLRIAPKQLQSGSWITENCPKTVSEWFANHWESPQNNFKVVWELLRITQIQFQSGLWITENHQESLRITKNCWESHKTIRSYLFSCPRPNDTNADHCIYSDFQWFSLILWIPFSHSVKTTGIDDIAVLANFNEESSKLTIEFFL